MEFAMNVTNCGKGISASARCNEVNADRTSGLLAFWILQREPNGIRQDDVICGEPCREVLSLVFPYLA